MIRSSVTISLVEEARGGPFVFWDDLAAGCKAAQELGFDAVEVFPPGPDAVDPKSLRRLLGKHGLALAAVGTGAGWVRHKKHLCLPEASGRDGLMVTAMIVATLKSLAESRPVKIAEVLDAAAR